MTAPVRALKAAGAGLLGQAFPGAGELDQVAPSAGTALLQEAVGQAVRSQIPLGRKPVETDQGHKKSPSR